MHADRSPSRHAPLVRRCLVVVVVMFGFGFALVPAYRIFCEVTGFQGFISAESDGRDGGTHVGGVDETRTVTVELVASVNGRAPWGFKPLERRVEVHPGELVTTRYRAVNETEEPRSWQASYNVAPGNAGRFFGKPDCFCFQRQEFLPGEERDLPVTFFVSPELPAGVETVTLSYTLFDLAD